MSLLSQGRSLRLICFVATAIAGAAEPALSQSASIEGRIHAFECGDNCYLTIIDKRNKVHTGLCTAPECAAWNEVASMPSREKGKRVVVTLGQGIQIDAAGTAMGNMIAFKRIRFLD